MMIRSVVVSMRLSLVLARFLLLIYGEFAAHLRYGLYKVFSEASKRLRPPSSWAN
jgi:hypothetical protein